MDSDDIVLSLKTERKLADNETLTSHHIVIAPCNMDIETVLLAKKEHERKLSIFSPFAVFKCLAFLFSFGGRDWIYSPHALDVAKSKRERESSALNTNASYQKEKKKTQIN